MTIFSPSRVSVLLLSTVLTAATATLIYYYGTTQLKLGRLASFFAAIAFVICRITQEGSSAVMLDIPITLCAFLALIVYVRYLDTERWIYSVLFGVIAAMAMLIKGNGALLALLPPFVIVLSRRWALMGRFSFWAPALVVALLAAPWYILTYGQIAAGFRYSWGAEYSRVAIVENSKILLSALGPVVVLLTGIGLVSGGRRGSIFPPSGFNGVVALLAAVWVFQSTAPAAIQDRYLAPLLPPLFLLAALGGQVVAGTLERRVVARVAGPLVFALILMTMLPSALNAEVKPQLGFRELAKTVWANRISENPVVLIAARGRAEVAAIAELAMMDPARPSLFAVRGSRLLGGGGYNRQDYLPKFADADQVAAEIDRYHIPLVLYQVDPGGWMHVAQVEAVRSHATDSWKLLGTAGTAESPVDLYKLPQAIGQEADVKLLLELASPKALQ
ncbi:MAG: phospholipid carrier-dependent glycosyltransferase [Rhodospirillaceae bacterium]|nr:MAG: phospholipid carrier-dependent glycosyltransferase [Rhodospirillaceae bacterium]